MPIRPAMVAASMAPGSPGPNHRTAKASLTGLRATRPRLARDDRTDGSSFLTANFALTRGHDQADHGGQDRQDHQQLAARGQLERLASTAVGPAEEDHQQERVDDGPGQRVDPDGSDARGRLYPVFCR